jgi:hypothetical protein
MDFLSKKQIQTIKALDLQHKFKKVKELKFLFIFSAQNNAWWVDLMEYMELI